MMTLRRAAAWLALLLPAALLTGALGSQYIGGLVPCEMCLWQRWPHWAALPLAALGIAFVTRSFGRVCTLLAALAILISGLIGGFHAGVEYGWWEGLTACTTSMDPNASAEDVLTNIMEAPLVRCDQAQWEMFGISLAGYNFLLSGAAALAIFLVAGRPMKRREPVKEAGRDEPAKDRNRLG